MIDSADPPKRTAAWRVLALLGAFSRGGGSLTLSQLSRYADLSLTTTHRLVGEVMEWGGLEQDAEGRYRLSSKILNLASSSTQALRLREHALPHLLELHRQTGLGVQLGVRDDSSVMFLEALRTHPNYSGENRIGGRLPLHGTASGLVLLAYAMPDVVDDYLEQRLARYTPHTVIDPDTIRGELEIIRKRRYALGSQLISLEAGSVAAPVLNEELIVAAAVNVVFFVDRDDPQRLIKPVLETANRISRSLAEVKSAPDPRTVDFRRRQAGLA